MSLVRVLHSLGVYYLSVLARNQPNWELLTTELVIVPGARFSGPKRHSLNFDLLIL